MRVYAGTLSCTVCRLEEIQYRSLCGKARGVWLAVAVHSTLTINLGRAVGKLKCDDGDDKNEVDD